MVTRESHYQNHFVEDTQGNRILTPRLGCELCQESIHHTVDITMVTVKCLNLDCGESGIEKSVRMTTLGNNVFSVPSRYVCGSCGQDMEIVR